MAGAASDSAVRRQKSGSVAQSVRHSSALWSLFLLCTRRDLPLLLSWDRRLDVRHLLVRVDAAVEAGVRTAVDITDGNLVVFEEEKWERLGTCIV